jgi:hypothetical protein
LVRDEAYKYTTNALCYCFIPESLDVGQDKSKPSHVICAFGVPVKPNFNDSFLLPISSPHEQRQLSLYSGAST